MKVEKGGQKTAMDLVGMKTEMGTVYEKDVNQPQEEKVEQCVR